VEPPVAPARGTRRACAVISALLDGYTDAIQLIVDISEPTQPREVGRWWLPGMWRVGGEQPAWLPGKRFALHHSIVAGTAAYGAWRDGGYILEYKG
jgi:hypothetical protein